MMLHAQLTNFCQGTPSGGRVVVPAATHPPKASAHACMYVPAWLARYRMRQQTGKAYLQSGLPSLAKVSSVTGGRPLSKVWAGLHSTVRKARITVKKFIKNGSLFPKYGQIR